MRTSALIPLETKSLTGLIGLILLAAGCSTQQIVERNAVSSDRYQEGTPAYRAGWEHGCGSRIHEGRGWMGIAGDRFVRDDARMQTDSDYALGWHDGARNCDVTSGGGSFIYAPRK
jgi:hypothetical protein